ncbi:hypothetical protein L1049_009036 [Liquidambar formosana]|uniref:EF-hand domain-containing protein n=1 Tax=Liquidambar formosana TaxID=63359 RepID=A0AAP0X8P0_LIQFO
MEYHRKLADSDGSGLIDDKELQTALSSYNQSFSLRTVHLLMYLFTNSNARKIGTSIPRFYIIRQVSHPNFSKRGANIQASKSP